jgi:predicted nucleic acid-binding protein
VPLDLIVPDTSVLVKWLLVHEVDAGRAAALREAYLEGRVLLAIPALAQYEVASVLQGLRGVSEATVAGFLGALTALSIPVIGPDPAMLTRAVRLGRTTGLALYDAVFAQLADEAGGVWITADMRALDRLPRGFPAGTLAEWVDSI